MGGSGNATTLKPAKDCDEWMWFEEISCTKRHPPFILFSKLDEFDFVVYKETIFLSEIQHPITLHIFDSAV